MPAASSRHGSRPTRSATRARVTVEEPTAVRSVDAETLHRAVDSRDARFDGRVFLGVTSTGIYCRPSCPARRPRRENRRFFGSSAAAVAAGFRACRMCRPDTVPGSREWDHRGDLAARALTLISAGYVDEHGVSGLAAHLHVSERHLGRVLVGEVGASPLRIARSRRAQTARLLIDQTSLLLADVAFAAGFASVRQFNDVMREEFGFAPSHFRRSTASVDEQRAPRDGSLVLRLSLREPYDAAAMLDWFGGHAVPGVEERRGTTFARTLSTAHGDALVAATPETGHLTVRLVLPDLADLAAVVSSVRRCWDLDADPLVIDAALSADPLLAPLVAGRPGLRVPVVGDGFELAARTVIGQQVSVAGARTLAGRLVERIGPGLTVNDAGLTHAFPSAEQLQAAAAAGELAGIGLTGARVAALAALAGAVVDGLDLGPGADRDAVRAALLALPGVGPWTADYVALRGLGDPDAWVPGDLVLRRAVETLGADPQRWRPWRAYAAMHLWTDHSHVSRPSTLQPTEES